MNQRLRPRYADKTSTQTLREGLEEYYALNPNITDPRQLPPEFAKILLAHDVSHIVYGCDTGMYDELKLLPLTWWTSNYKFRNHLQTLKDPNISPAIRVISIRIWVATFLKCHPHRGKVLMTHFGIICSEAMCHLNTEFSLAREIQRCGHRITVFGKVGFWSKRGI
jgi:hypothetical protein